MPTTTDQHALIATGLDGEIYLGGRYESYAAAVDAWYKHDDARRAGLRPHVKHYEVRSIDDPKIRTAEANGSYARPQSLFRSVIRRSRGFSKPESAAGGAIRRFIPEPQDCRFPGHTRVQGEGGWYFEANGKTLAQGRGDLARVARRRGWIVQDANGRWHIVSPLETDGAQS